MFDPPVEGVEWMQCLGDVGLVQTDEKRMPIEAVARHEDWHKAEPVVDH